MSSDQTVTLIDQVIQGDRAAFAHVIEEHQSVIYGFLRARVLQPTDAEDLTQEVFLRFYVNRERFDRDQPLRPWLLGIARNLLKEHVRQKSRRKEVAWTALCLELDELVKTQPDEDIYDDALQHLPGCLDSLGPSAREAVQLRYRSNLRLSAIGEKLQRSEGAIKLLMFRARQALKHCLTGKLRSNNHD